MKRAAEEFDVIVVGAGAAGLSAAAEFSSADLSVCVVDARERMGGRILTMRDDDGLPPAELGAEFIHGESPATLEWLRKAVSLFSTRRRPDGYRVAEICSRALRFSRE